MIQIKRIYDSESNDDGYRVLVDRLWPRGVSKEDAHIDMWMKDIAPSTELRKWFGHETGKWSEFNERYKKELSDNKTLLDKLKSIEKEHKKVTLLYAAKDTEHNQAVVLHNVLISL